MSTSEARGFFILVVRASDRQSASAVLSGRLREGRWPLNQFTRHQNRLREGGRVLFYVAGQDKWQQHFVGQGEIAGSPTSSSQRPERDADWLGIAEPSGRHVPIQRARLFSNPISIRPLVETLAFIRKKEYWGAYLQGGVVPVSKMDFELVERLSTS